MPVARKSVESSSRRAEILATAAELFATKGFAGTTVRDIADSVGILSGSLYHHFKAKEDMVIELFTEYFDELTERWDAVLSAPGDSRMKFEAMLREAFNNVDRHSAAARLFTYEWMELRHLGDFTSRWAGIERTWLTVIEAGVDEGHFRRDVEPMLLFSVAMDLIRGMAGWYRHGKYSIATLSDAYISVIMSGVVVDASRQEVRPSKPARRRASARVARESA